LAEEDSLQILGATEHIFYSGSRGFEDIYFQKISGHGTPRRIWGGGGIVARSRGWGGKAEQGGFWHAGAQRAWGALGVNLGVVGEEFSQRENRT